MVDVKGKNLSFESSRSLENASVRANSEELKKLNHGRLCVKTKRLSFNGRIPDIKKHLKISLQVCHPYLLMVPKHEAKFKKYP